MIQSPNDTKQYQNIKLQNGLKVLLVHNGETQKSAAALAVNVGHFSDPCHRQGLAHFLEHMLFLGTEKFPDGSEYQKFISQYGGANNAWTATEHTCFFFDIHFSHFEQAIDRFSQFFIAPLLSEEFVNKERKNIDAEFKLKLKDEIRRLYDVHKETINPQHPFSKFSVGNTETLADLPNHSLRDEVETFYQQHYVASSMTLVLEGPQSLAELNDLATQYFSAVSGTPKTYELPDTPLYLPEQQGVAIHVQPVKNDRQLIINFALPSLDKYYQQKPESLLAYLIGHEGKGSILSLLKQKQWALALTAGSGINGYNFKDFNISIRLTESGEQHINEIISIVFCYIGLLKKQPLAKHYFQEKKAIAELSFNYHEKIKPLDSVCQLVINMQHYDEQHYIYGDYMMEDISADLLNELLSYFSPANFRYTHVSKKVDGDLTTRWYRVPYRVSPIEPALLKQWQVSDKEFSLSLPEPNQYIVSSPKVYADEQAVCAIPQCITEKDGIKVWYKQDQTFKVPKGYIYIGIDSPYTLISSQHIAMTRLFVDLYTDAVIEQHYDAELAGIHYHLYAHQGGLTLQLSGISTKQNLLLKQLLSELTSCQFNENKFTLLKRQLINHWRNTDTSKSISQLFSALSSNLQPKNPSPEELTEALEPVSFKEFIEHSKRIFEQVNIEVLIHGNWQIKHARDIESVITQTFANHAKSCFKEQSYMLDISGKGSLDYPLVLPHHDHAAVLYYPIAEKNLQQVALTMIVSQILSPQFFHQMRTERQYGYLVGVGFVPINRYPGIAFYIQSPKFDASILVNAICEFIDESHLLADAMSDQDWQHLQHGLASQLQEKDTSLRIKSQRFWSCICNEEYTFDQKAKLIEIIKQINKQDIRAFLFEKLSNMTGVKDRVCLMSIKQKQDTSLEKVHDILKNCSIKY
ncbi:insulinase family protein [Thalassotalea marina]|uniref:insulinase family protein n=1 Tax=Thalassotalea marina TaxID=1673741 RepID=UPI001676FC0C|nr:insulinase family protein [Thalassotalea marina]